VTAHFADGTQASTDILIGADGIRSTVRSLIDPAAPQPRYVGLLDFDGKLADAGLGPTGGAMHFIFGKRAFFGYQVFDDGRGGWFASLPHPRPMTMVEARTVGAEE
jgi:FAD-dependent urate hydroxylase